LVVDAVNSVLAQTYRPIEIIVVDDGSTDRTLSVLKSLSKQSPEINVITQGNAGPGVARELGRQLAKGEFIQYLDSDDLLLPEKFEQQVKALKQQPECDIAYGKTEATLIGGPLKGEAMRQTGHQINTMFPLFLRESWWGTSTPLYRRIILDKAGPWLAIMNEEDWEYDCRIASLGGNLVFVNEFVSITRYHDNHLSAEGSTDPVKLKHRCIAQQHIYHHARSYMQLTGRKSEITKEDWSYYSKSLFLLARQCALANMPDHALQMVELSIAANGKARLKHRVFCFLAAFVGWRNASRFTQWLVSS